MDSPKCPECGTRRDIEFRRDEYGRLVLACIACGIERACCPYCRSFKVGYTHQGTMRCALCQREFIPPETRDWNWSKLTEDQLKWLIGIGNRLRLAKLDTFDAWAERTGGSPAEYVASHLKRFLVIPRLAAGAGQPLSVEEVEEKILAENIYVASAKHLRLKKAKELLDLLAEVSPDTFRPLEG